MAEILGVVGGSGIYELSDLAGARSELLRTPFGEPSDAYRLGRLGGQELVFLARHGEGHRLAPGEVNYRANLWGFKKLGVTRVVSFSAVGSLREEIAPGHVVLVDQFIDRTAGRKKTFFEDGIVAHAALGEPVCPRLRRHLEEAARAAGANVHPRGTYLCIEGPQFSTRAESELYRSWSAAVIGMTNLPEALLAREAELCYATVALATDYDSWRQEHGAVSVEEILRVLGENVRIAATILRNAAVAFPGLGARDCACGRALDHAVITAPRSISSATRQRLELLLGDRFRA